jgi:hypothetical protein
MRGCAAGSANQQAASCAFWAKHLRAWGMDRLSPAQSRALAHYAAPRHTLQFYILFAVCSLCVPVVVMAALSASVAALWSMAVGIGYGLWACAACGCPWLVGCGYLLRGLIFGDRKPGARRPPPVVNIIYKFTYCRCLNIQLIYPYLYPQTYKLTPNSKLGTNTPAPDSCHAPGPAQARALGLAAIAIAIAPLAHHRGRTLLIFASNPQRQRRSSRASS